MTRLYRLREGQGFAIDGPHGSGIGPRYDRTYLEDDPFFVVNPGAFDLVPGQAPDKVAEPVVIPRRGPGRPGWTDDLFRQRWREALERGTLAQPATYRSVALHFEALDGTIGEIDPSYLGKLAQKHGTE